ncbi:MAG TPA: hypothetical protein VH372_23275, partial [Actinospica sp.]|nr:hypothetical protein [Actinospica sp.]
RSRPKRRHAEQPELHLRPHDERVERPAQLGGRHLPRRRTGRYQLWLNKGFSPLEVIAADNGYTPVMKIAKVTAGKTTNLLFALNSSSATTQSAVQAFLNSHLHIRSRTP